MMSMSTQCKFNLLDRFVDERIDEEVREILHVMKIYAGDENFDKEYETLQQEITLDGTRNWDYEHKQYWQKELRKMKARNFR